MTTASHAASPSPTAPWLRIGRDYVSIEVVARPGAARSQIVRADDRGLVIAIAAPPERGKANEELVRLIGRIVEVPRSSVSIVRGESGRRKTVRVNTSDPAACVAKLKKWAN